MKDDLAQFFADKIAEIKEAFGELTVAVTPAYLLEVARALKEEERFKFEFLSDLTGIDCGSGNLEVVYHLLSLLHKQRLRLKVKTDGGSKLPSVVSIWPTANWHERESYDLLGIVFEGHPDLKRIITPDGFTGHPLRKDYPLKGEN